MQMIDNINEFVKDDLKKEIKPSSKVSIAAACFSMYAYQELKKELSDIAELRFLFTSPTFTTEQAPKEKREFYIPRLSRESSLYGSEFEIRLRNELTQKAIAKECAEWIRRKVKFKSNTSGDNITGFLNVEGPEGCTYYPLNGFTTIDIGCERGNNSFNFVMKHPPQASRRFIQTFNSLWHDAAKMQDVTDVVIDNITAAYRENAPWFIYFLTLYNIFSEFLEDISEDELPNEGVGFRNSQIWKRLFDFQRDAVLAIINKLEKYNGCILADSVGLGKTFSALAVMKYYEDRNKNVLVLCPKKLSNNWNTFKGNYVNNPIAGDRLRYDVLYHTDLSRHQGESNGVDLSRLRWDTYDLVVIDESHNFRNGADVYGNDEKRENRYLRLLNKVIRSGVRTKVLMLSATPVNNRFLDLKNQLELAYEGHSAFLEDKLNTKHSINEIFRQAQKEFNIWIKLPPDERTAEALLDRLEVALKSASVNNQLLHSIDKSLHYHVLFLLRHGERYMASMGYKGSPEQTVQEYFATAWMAFAELPLQIIGPTMDDVVDNFLRQIHQGLNDFGELPLNDAIQALAWQKRQDNEIAKLEKLLRAEKQPKRKFELKQQITTIQNSTGDIHGQAEHAYAQRRGQEY